MGPRSTLAPGTQPLAELTSQLQRRTWSSGFILATVLTPLSLARAFSTGWLPLYTLHIVIYAVALAVQLAGDRLSPRTRALCAITYLEIAGGLGLFQMGFLGFGCLWLAATGYLGAIVLGLRAGVVVVILNLGLMLVAMLGFRAGVLAVPVEANAYMRSPQVWLLALTMMIAFPWMLMNSVVHYRDAIVNLLRKTDEQRAEIERLASHDDLTGLVQVRVAHDRLQLALHRAERTGRQVAVMFLDLDGFKAVNDRHGHAAGDHVLRTVANLLRSVVRDSDTASRLGGDEFLLVLDNLASDETVLQIARRLLGELRRPIPYQDTLLRVGVSIGISMYPANGATMADLLKAADEAMYRVKGQGKSGFLLSSSGQVERATELAGRTGEFRRIELA